MRACSRRTVDEAPGQHRSWRTCLKSAVPVCVVLCSRSGSYICHYQSYEPLAAALSVKIGCDSWTAPCCTGTCQAQPAGSQIAQIDAMSAYAVVGAVVTLGTLIPPLHKPIKQWCQPVLWKLIPQQLQPVQWAQRLQHPVLEWMVLLSAATVTVEFYVGGLAIMIWCGLQRQALLLLGVLGLVGHVVFRVKDLLESPRPADCIKAAPQQLSITVKDYSGDIEDGIPSAHCCASVMLLYYAINAATAAGCLSSNVQLYAHLAAATWVMWIAYGRLYLGVHSPIDLAVGAMLGWVLVALWQQIEQPIIMWVVSSQHVQWQAPLVASLLLRTYPMANRYTDTFNYAIAWLGGWAGSVAGYRCVFPAADGQHVADAAALFRWGSTTAPTASSGCSPPGSVNSDSAMSCITAVQEPALLVGLIPIVVVKCFVGLVVTALTKVIVKKIMMLLLQPLLSCVPHSIRCLWQPPVAEVGKCDSFMSSSAAVRPRASQQEQHMHERVLLHSGHNQGSTNSSLTPLRPDVPSDTTGSLQSRCSSFRVLRHDQNGMAHDVVFTAKFVSYLSVGFVINTMDLWWQPLVSHLVFRSSIA